MEAKRGQVRRLHIIYFLSRMGHVEQPHLIRVHHLTRGGGVYLRDVKRWLADLRGKDMPEAFSWSYKRKYKTGYVWQDLVDDDLITPISDNEYVLQGSEIIPSLFDHPRFSSSAQRTTAMLRQEEDKPQQPIPSRTEDFQRNPVAKVKNPQLKKFPLDQMNGESPPCGSERSTITDDTDSMKVEEESKHLETAKPERREEEAEEVEKFKNQYSSLYSRLLNNKKKKKKDKGSMEKEGIPTPTSSISFSSSSSAHSGAFTKSKSYSNGASKMLRQWITCGAVDTNDAVLIKSRSAKDASNQLAEKPEKEAKICKGDKLGGSARVLGTRWDRQLEIPQHQRQHSSGKSCDGGTDSRKKRQKECSSRKVASAAYKPMRGPNCSQCGKMFRPEKMHAHMKSCRGPKSFGKTASTSDMTSSKSTTSTSHKEIISGYLLTD